MCACVCVRACMYTCLYACMHEYGNNTCDYIQTMTRIFLALAPEAQARFGGGKHMQAILTLIHAHIQTNIDTSRYTLMQG